MKINSRHPNMADYQKTLDESWELSETGDIVSATEKLAEASNILRQMQNTKIVTDVFRHSKP